MLQVLIHNNNPHITVLEAPRAQRFDDIVSDGHADEVYSTTALLGRFRPAQSDFEKGAKAFVQSTCDSSTFLPKSTGTVQTSRRCFVWPLRNNCSAELVEVTSKAVRFDREE